LLRLKGYDYTQPGAYFITICSRDRTCLFGEVVDGRMRINDAGQLAVAQWSELSERFPLLEIDAFVLMPNHVHGILMLSETVGAPLVGAPDGGVARDRAATRCAPTIGDIVGAFKSSFTVNYIKGVKENRWPAFEGGVWQRNYYEHIIRDEAELARIRRYIDENPLRWTFDRENPERQVGPS
jgi:REP-associated tyrosine transposase